MSNLSSFFMRYAFPKGSPCSLYLISRIELSALIPAFKSHFSLKVMNKLKYPALTN